MIRNVTEYLSEQAKKQPAKKALGYKEQSVSFSELELRARRYAGAIHAMLPTSSSTPIGVFCCRDIEPIIAFMGVLFSGNFYIPIDSAMPEEKLKSIVEDSNLLMIIGQDNDRELTKRINFQGCFLTPDMLSSLTYREEGIPLDAPLYMVYTSGSTGKPKGVLKSHRAEISYLEAFCETFDFDEQDVIGNQTPFYFDAAAKDIYLMLKLGITLEIIPTEYFPLPPELMEYLNKKKITFASWVPTVLSIVAQLNPFSLIKPETLKKVFFVGEVMPVKHLNTWRQSLPDLQYVNLYGQSELCGICCYYEVKETFPNDAVLPMGIPLKNCKVYLLAEDKVITQSGQIGEMYIVSDALALEYYHDSEKTERSFLVKDFGAGPERCFKTGDLAQYDEQGNLLFASRSDFQIKHMGHRIELGEIETVAGALPEIARCCCMYHTEKRKIMLFCELAEGCNVTGVALKSILKTKLSAYMVPGKVSVIEKLPLNANGKIDRQKLKTLM